MRVHGVVLAGGRSRRMGRDKAAVELLGRPLLAWVIEHLAPQCASLLVSRHEEDAAPASTGYLVVTDAVPGQAGPLAGILAALDALTRIDPSATHAATCAVDTPFLPPDFVARLCAAAATEAAPAAVAVSGERRHPVSALWPVSARSRLRQTLVEQGSRRVGACLDGLGPAVARWPVVPFDPFFNVNTPEDLAVAERIARGLGRR